MEKKQASILKEDANIIIEKTDINDPKVIAQIEEIQKAQEKILDRKNIELGSLKLVIQL